MTVGRALPDYVIGGIYEQSQFYFNRRKFGAGTAAARNAQGNFSLHFQPRLQPFLQARFRIGKGSFFL
jgi:hypothetical protein